MYLYQYNITDIKICIDAPQPADSEAGQPPAPLLKIFSLRPTPVSEKRQRVAHFALNRTRHLFIRQQTAVINAIRAHLAEFGIVAPVGRNGVEQLLVPPISAPAAARCCARFNPSPRSLAGQRRSRDDRVAHRI